MKTATALSLSLLLVAPLGLASLGGCAGDKNKQLEEAARQEAEASRAQREAQIDQTKTQQLEGIERNKPSTENLPEGKQQLAKAQSAMVEERQKFQADAKARLQKVEARLDEARRKLQIAGGRAATSVHDKLDQASHLAAGLSGDIDHVAQVSNDAWATEKKRIEKLLDDIEGSADDVKAKADDVKK